VDHIFLKENAVTVPALLTKQLQPLIDEGFLHLSTLPGPKHPLQNRWYNRCSKPDMAGKHSWIAFIDLDEYVVVLDKCASPEPAATMWTEALPYLYCLVPPLHPVSKTRTVAESAYLLF
jgi:hypothetical protein